MIEKPISYGQKPTYTEESRHHVKCSMWRFEIPNYIDSPQKTECRDPKGTGSIGFDDIPGILGVEALRPHQLQAITAIVDHDSDALLVSPTGSGKTLAFVGAGLLLGGITLVVSPLRSLIADQLRRIQAWGIPVRIWNSDVNDAAKSETLALIRAGAPMFFYTTPESLSGRELKSALVDRVRLAVIDEAHVVLKDCAYRHHYAKLGLYLDDVRPSRRFACTATLTEADRVSLIQSLRLREPEDIMAPVGRDNLEIRIVDRNPTVLADILNRHRGHSGIVFCATVRTAQTIYGDLKECGHNVTIYHGKLSAKERKEAQAGFMGGVFKVTIVTDAFLLGIDKADIRFIAHYDHPESVESWAQGFGRAGRDGLPAAVYGMFKGNDDGKQSRRFLVCASHPTVEAIRKVWDHLTSQPWHNETAQQIVESALGPDGRYAATGILSTLKRFQLLDTVINPKDRRRRLYRARGDFDAADWNAYRRERVAAVGRFDLLCELVSLPVVAIPGAIDAYFSSAASDSLQLWKKG